MGMNGGIHDAFNLAEKLAAVIRGQKPVEELERYERQRRPVALEYVNTITIANKRHLEMRDAGEQRRWRADLARAMTDRTAGREYMLKLSMIASLRKYECA
jgi:3-(3-hydroxy-phenyl)propionate hydroxylase